MTILIRSQMNRMASRISASVAVTIRSTCREMTAKVRGPSEVRRPSAMVWGSFEGWIEPVSSDRRASSALAGSAPTTRVDVGAALDGQGGPGEQAAAADRADDHVERARPGRAAPARRSPGRR